MQKYECKYDEISGYTVPSDKGNFYLVSEVDAALAEKDKQIATLKAETDRLGRIEIELRKLLQEWKRDYLELTTKNNRLQDSLICITMDETGQARDIAQAALGKEGGK